MALNRSTKNRWVPSSSGVKLFYLALILAGAGIGLSVFENSQDVPTKPILQPGGGLRMERPTADDTELERFLHSSPANRILSEHAASEARAVGGVELAAFCFWLGRNQQLPLNFLEANSDLILYIAPGNMDELLTAFAGNTEAILKSIDKVLREGIEIQAGPATSLQILEKLSENPRRRDGVSVVWPVEFNFGVFIRSPEFKSQTVEGQAWMVARMPGVDPGGYISTNMSFEAVSHVIKAFSEYREKDLELLLMRMVKNGVTFNPPAGSDEVFATGNEIGFSSLADGPFLRFLTSGAAGENPLLLAESVASARIRSFGNLQMVLNEGLTIPDLPVRRAYLSKAVKEVAVMDPALASSVINANDTSPDADCMVQSLLPFITDPAVKQRWESKLAELTAQKQQ